MRRVALAAVPILGLVLPASADFENGFAAYLRGDYVEALKEFLPLAEQGEAEAQYHLGLMYDEGEGVPEDDAEAVKWYLGAAEQGHLQAQSNLALMYYEGRGVPQNSDEAEKWRRKTAEQGGADAQNHLGLIYEMGSVLPQDDAKAAYWYNRAADLGLAEAQRNVARMFEIGKGVPTDITQAVKWYGRAAEQDDGDAQYRLGQMYRNGEGVPQDHVLAYMWFNLAAVTQNTWNQNRDDRHALAKKLSHAQVAEAQRRATAWWEKRHDMRDDHTTYLNEWRPINRWDFRATAHYVIGQRYLFGDGVPQDYAEAVAWFHEAAEQGDFRAQAELGRMYERGRVVMPDYVQAHTWYTLAGYLGEALFPGTRDRMKHRVGLLEARMTLAQIAEAEGGLASG